MNTEIDPKALASFKKAFPIFTSGPVSGRALQDLEKRIGKEELLGLQRTKSLVDQLTRATVEEPIMTRQMKIDLLKEMIDEAESNSERLERIHNDIRHAIEKGEPYSVIPKVPPPPEPDISPPDLSSPTPPQPRPPSPPPGRGNEPIAADVVAREDDEEVFLGEPVGEFAPVDEPFGRGLWKVKETVLYRPSSPVEIPGTGFNAVVPGQSHVNRKIVELKIEKGLPESPIVPAVRDPEGRLALADKHHTFVACMAMGRPVKLAITGMAVGTKDRMATSWKTCTWKGFEKPKIAAGGFSLSPAESLEHEGPSVKNPHWREVIPWRRSMPKDVEGKVAATTEKLPGIEMGHNLLEVCEVNPGVADMLYELMHVDMIAVSSRGAREGSTGGDWDPDEGKIYLDDNLDPLATVDMLVFEALNAANQHRYRDLEHEAYDTRLNLTGFGVKKAKIEAEVTLAHLDFLINCKNAGREIAPLGQRVLDEADRRVEGYTSMTPEDRQRHHATLVQLISNTPHGGPDKRLPDRTALSTADLYAYEHATYKQGVKGLRSYFRDVIGHDHEKAAAFYGALLPIKFGPTEGYSWAGMFYDVVSRAAQDVLGVSVTLFNPAQREVARYEYQQANGDWAESLDTQLRSL